MNHLILKLRVERDVIRLRNPTEDKRAFRRILTSADHHTYNFRESLVTTFNVQSSISVPLDRCGFGGWNIMPSERSERRLCY